MLSQCGVSKNYCVLHNYSPTNRSMLRILPIYKFSAKVYNADLNKIKAQLEKLLTITAIKHSIKILRDFLFTKLFSSNERLSLK